ncbi:terminase gpA endonuclease subunit [Rhizobium leguminosarum]|uniref:terminase gpA endonuclease subunit n=1 Tax=Rhizobium leguminosarum TaxID=384 RepID=UPI003F9E903C
MLNVDHGDIAGSLLVDFSEGLAALRMGVGELRDDALQPRPWMDPETWMHEHIDLPKSKTERSGKLVLTGYQREFLRLYFDPETSEIDGTKGIRVGMSLLLSTLAAYILDYLGESVTIAQPTEEDAKQFYKERIEPLFTICPSLGAKRRQPARGESQDTWNLIEFTNGAVLRLVGAASDDSFRRYGSKHNWGDEYSANAWRPKAGSQGSKADLFMGRGGEYARPKLVLISSPTVKGECLTTERYDKSDKQEPWNACPHCREMQVFEWGEKDTPYGFKLQRDAHGFVTEVHYECRHCHEPIREHDRFEEPVTVNGRECFTHKEYLDATTQYRPSATWKVPGRRGMYVPQWLSPNGQAAWKLLGQSFLNNHKDPEERKTWVNNVMGVAFDDMTTTAMDASDGSRWVKDYPAEVPDDVVVLTMGVDTQTNKEGNHLEELASREATVVGFNRFGQKRVIGHWIVEGAPGDPASDARLRALINRKFKKRDGKELGILATAIDLGGHYADEVRAFCASFLKNRNVWAVKGRNNAKGTRSATAWPRKVSKSSKSGAHFYVIDSQLCRDAVFRYMQMRGDNAMWVPSSILAAYPRYLDKLLCEERRKVKAGWYWQPRKGQRAEEFWMCLAYAYAALKGLQASYSAWRDLNVAAGYLEIPMTPHDPVTGEIDYDGPDLSAHAIERMGSGIEMAAVAATPPFTKPSKKASAQAEERKAAPIPAQVAQPPKQAAPKAKKVLKQFKSSWGRGW